MRALLSKIVGASMADDKRKQRQDRKLVAASQPYELRYFARKWALTTEQAVAIIKAHGPSRKACNEAARLAKLATAAVNEPPYLGKI